MTADLEPPGMGQAINVNAPTDAIGLARPVGRPAADEILLVESTRRAVWADLGLATVCVVATELMVGCFLALLRSTWGVPEDHRDSALERALLPAVLAVRAAGVMLFLAGILRHRGQSLRSVGVGRQRFGIDCLIGLGAVVAAYTLIYASQFVLFFFWAGLWEAMAENAGRLMELVPKQHPFGFARVALVIGLYEEVLFRGFVMPRLRRATGSWTLAVVVTTAIFALLHLPHQVSAALIPITILSLVFSVVTVWRRSIIPAIVGHFLFDFVNFIWLYLLSGDCWT